VQQWKIREGCGRAGQAASGQGSAGPQRKTLKLGFKRRAAAEGREWMDYGVLFCTLALQYT
jgi:hypothetical protein